MSSQSRTDPTILILCPDCKDSLPRWKMPEHRAFSCKRRLLHCPKCYERIEASKILFHLQLHISCQYCDSPLYLDDPADVSRHQLVKCLFCDEPIPACCMFSHVFCGGQPCYMDTGSFAQRSSFPPQLASIAADSQQACNSTEDIVSAEAMTFSKDLIGPNLFYPNPQTITFIQHHPHPLYHQSAMVMHPGFTSGILEWDLMIGGEESYCDSITFGVSPPLKGSFPGAADMPGSIGKNSLFGEVVVDGKHITNGFIIRQNDILTVRLNMDQRTVSWIRNSRPNTAITHSLPLGAPSRYALAIGLCSAHSSVTIKEFRQLSASQAISLTCPHAPLCQWHGLQIDLPPHLKIHCPGQRIPCLNAKFGCPETRIPRGDLAAHLLNCRYLGCEGCNHTSESQSQMVVHLNSCPQHSKLVTSFIGGTGHSKVYSGHVPDTTLIRHPGFHSGVVQWELMCNAEAGLIAACQPLSNKLLAGSLSPSSIALIGTSGKLASRSHHYPGGFRFGPGTRVLIRIDCNRREVSWIKDDDITNIVVSPFPSETARLTMGVGSHYQGDSFTIQSCTHLLPEQAQHVTCPHHNHPEYACEWTGLAIDLQDHVRCSCPHALVRCPNAQGFGCRHISSHLSVKQHIRHCRHHGCAGCRSVFKSQDSLLAHLDTCSQMLLLATSFKPPLVTEASHLLPSTRTVSIRDKGRTVEMVANDFLCVLLSHPGFYFGKYCWDILCVIPDSVVIGVTPNLSTQRTGDYPGSETFRGSIGLSSNGDIEVGSQCIAEGFQFHTGDVISVVLDMDNHAISWTKNYDKNTRILQSLPHPRFAPLLPYTLAAGLENTGSRATILAFHTIDR
eukprot:gnl/Dysnectes_brevis/2832_a3457_1151.p1 GENE.gnl/Dysnectes_brevis/2832_a3457_1151~~gnl/Dysnectes_brevis/2832_a3457_1151.p1  ORF type:complete len:842 (+),score=187.38 gnl/Dysnectes_brevis/2832_a3457_1151:575-3100(+)